VPSARSRPGPSPKSTRYATQFARLRDLLDAIPEGNGTLLDNCCVLWGSELGTGNTHSFKSTPFVAAGGLPGAFATGRYLEYSENAYHNRLLISVCQAFRMSGTTTFGNTDTGSGGLPGVLKV
jgi:hypothetical protein